MSARSPIGTRDNQRGLYRAGSGSPLVLLHGIGGTWHGWQPVLAQLAVEHTVIALTLPGHDGGAAIPHGQDINIGWMADTLLRELNSLGLDDAHVVGNSLGGWMALELHRRGFARSVTALSPAGAWVNLSDTRSVSISANLTHFIAQFTVARCILGKTMQLPSIRKAILSRAMEHGDRLSAKEAALMLRSMQRTAVLPDLLKSVERDGPIKPLAAGATPIRIAWSEFDRVIPFERFGRPLVERVEGAEVITLKGVGHTPMHDDPGGVVRTILEVTRPRDTAA